MTSALGAMDGFAEAQQRDGIVSMHPGGTTDIQRVIMARRLGIGKRAREQAGVCCTRPGVASAEGQRWTWP